MRVIFRFSILALTFLFVACNINNDVPFPIVLGQFTEFEVEGECPADGGNINYSKIDNELRTVTLYVNDTVDLTNLRIVRVGIAGIPVNADINYLENPIILPDETTCGEYENFPLHGFSDSIDVRMNFTRPVKFTLRTYQDYIWTVTVHRVVKRQIQVENQVGEAIIDPTLCNAIVYVAPNQSLKRLKVHKFTLGGEHGIVSPDPTEEEASNFYDVRQFEVRTGWGDLQTWNVAVHKVDSITNLESAVKSSVNAWSNFALIEASLPMASDKFKKTSLRIEWKKADDSDWDENSHVIEYYELTESGTDNIKATLKGLEPNTTYEYRLCYEDGEEEFIGSSITFTTEEQIPLYNGGFENWWVNGNVAYPNEQGFSYWDTSNPGSASFGGSNTVETINPVHGGGKAAKLESKYIVIKFAAASLYTGTFGQLIGTNGAKLNWGVPFASRPTALKGYMQYSPKVINRVGKNLPADAPTEGDLDQCTMYCALLSEALVVDNTNMNTFPDWENDPRVIAYGTLPAEQNVDSKGKWKRVNIPFVYRDLDKKPTHLLVVFSASKYGDYFHGGEGSTLYVDDFSLEYGDSPLVR